MGNKRNAFEIRTDSDKLALIDNAKNHKSGLKKSIQKIGSFMAGMIMPSVSLLIAWGLLASMFLGGYKVIDGKEVWVSTGWFDVESLGQLIGPGMKYLIPILIGYTAGNMIYKTRGGMLGAFITLATIIGNDWIYAEWASDWTIGGNPVSGLAAPNQIVAAMTIVPLCVLIFKKVESLYIEKIKAGYEMLVRNFSLALIALVLAIGVYMSWGFVMYGVSYVMISIISFFTTYKWMFPFMAIFTEPLRSVFLNNALNFGVMIPLGQMEVDTNGFSKFFMVGGNPGPGFGLLLAYAAWRKQQRASAAGSSAIQLIGGIHEVHYVYILAEPIMVLATIGGAFVSLGIVALFQGGAIAAISPGSLISVVSMSGTGLRIGINVAAVFAGALTSFGIASFIMIFKRKQGGQLAEVSVSDEGITFGGENDVKSKSNVSLEKFDWRNAKLIMVACDAGMGSSAMAAGIIRKWTIKNKIDIKVKNCAVKDLDNECDIVVTMYNFMEFAKDKSPNALIYPVKQFLGNGIFDDLYEQLKIHKQLVPKEVANELSAVVPEKIKLLSEDIFLDVNLENKIDAIKFVGKKLVNKNYVKPEYVDSMIRRDAKDSVAIGNFLAIPHCEDKDRDLIVNSGLVFAKVKTPFEWDGKLIYFVIALGLAGENQIDILQEIAIAFSDENKIKNLYENIKSPEDVLNFIYE